MCVSSMRAVQKGVPGIARHISARDQDRNTILTVTVTSHGATGRVVQWYSTVDEILDEI